MANISAVTRRSISLNEMIALAEEMAAVARAGVPLEAALVDSARDLSAPGGKLASEIGRRLQGGEELSQILQSSPAMLPSAYRAVIEAGIRSGRLSAALEGLAANARRMVELRGLTRSAIMYPLVVALLAYGLFVLSVLYFQPMVTTAYAQFRVPQNWLNQLLVRLGDSVVIWGPVVPLAVVLLLVLWWRRSGRAGGGESRIAQFLFPQARLLRFGRIAMFADLLALLIDQDVPLGSSLILAADASGDAGLGRAARGLAEQIERGETADVPRAAAAGCPAMLAWVVSRGAHQPFMVESLRRISESYRRQAERLQDRLRLYLPLVLSVFIGGTAVVIYAITVLWPWYDLMFDMTEVY